jgi:hypothetical protein
MVAAPMGRPRPPLATHPRPAAAFASRLLVIAGFALFALLIAGIVLTIFEADSDNAIVDLVLDVAGFFGAPFEGIFHADDRETQVVFDWGLAAFVWALIAMVVAAVVNRAGRMGH